MEQHEIERMENSVVLRFTYQDFVGRKIVKQSDFSDLSKLFATERGKVLLKAFHENVNDCKTEDITNVSMLAHEGDRLGIYVEFFYKRRFIAANTPPEYEGYVDDVREISGYLEKLEDMPLIPIKDSKRAGIMKEFMEAWRELSPVFDFVSEYCPEIKDMEGERVPIISSIEANEFGERVLVVRACGEGVPDYEMIKEAFEENQCDLVRIDK